MDTIIQVSIFVLLTALVAAITYVKCRKTPRDTNDSRDYFLAGGGLSWVVVAGSLVMTNISAEQIVGMNGAQTLLVAWWEIAAAVGLVILAKWLIPIYYKYNCTTTTELLEKKYNDKGIRAMVSVLFMMGYAFILLPVVLYTGSLFMKSMFNLDISVVVLAITFAIAGSIYAIFGGLRAIAISDTMNGIGLLLMGVVVSYLAMHAINWDLSGLPVENLTLIGDENSDIPWHTLFTGMIFIQIFYWGTNMVITQRALAAKSVREAQKGLYAAVFMKLIIPLIVVLPGLVALKLYGDVGDVAYGMLVGNVLPSWLSGAFAAVIAGAVLSSFNSCLNSAAALYTCDIHLNYVNDSADVKKVGSRVALVFTLIALCLVPVFAQSESIISLLQQLNGLYSMPVLAAFICALVFKNVHARAIKIGLVIGVGIYAVFTFIWSPLHFIDLMAITLAMTIGITLILSKVFHYYSSATNPATT
ncbi:solute:sodium symporter family transporter [Parashewanella spongiae]|uniref:Solute:sodium symporter family transporter n=1 Tax=Parashewanella spongiae TaxID=342950 RepID=A0A3A6TH69_9GAMM|nr:solute:sodium symporter family transporter [Parashewanella spongiae]MCL1079719.1 solute:sodium symporter family transporter [Parashewanella spongiae]RJY07002.1 solute:sodium symporter family transporter [Parashewanella spongiae]